jgi:hypothetical protein
MMTFLAALQSIVREKLRDLPRFFDCAHERHHHLHVRQAHFIAHHFQRAALQLEAGAESFVDVT